MMNKKIENKVHDLMKINFTTWLLGIFIIVFPFITYLHIEKLGNMQREVFFSTDGYVVDFFLYYKELVLIIFAAILFVITLVEFMVSKENTRGPIFLKSSRVIWFFALAGLILIIVSMLNAYKNGQTETVWMGTSTEYEGVLALISYLILFVCGYQYINTHDKKKFIIKCMMVLSFIIGLLALVEYNYKPIYEISFMKYFIAPKEYRSIAESLKVSQFSNQTTLSFYNPGYLGGCCALLFPINVGMIFLADNNRTTVLRSLVAVMLLFALITSTSTGALYGTIVSVILQIIIVIYLLLMKKNNNSKSSDTNSKLKLTKPIIICGITLLFVAGVYLISGGTFVKSVIRTTTHNESVEHKKNIFVIDAISLEDGVIFAKSGDKTIVIENKYGITAEIHNLEIKDEEGKELSNTITDNEMHITADGYEGVYLTLKDNILSIDFGYEDEVLFYTANTGFCLAGQSGGYLEEIPQPEVVGLEKYYSFATGRGYTWVQSLPLLKKCILVGYGSGNFAYNFNQNEVAGLLNTHGSSRFVVDKPHNMYIQMAVSSGILWVVIFGFMIVYLFANVILSIRNCEKNKKSMLKSEYNTKNCKLIILVSLSAGILAFLITGMVNDSIVAVNPLFWLMLGVTFNMALCDLKK